MKTKMKVWECFGISRETGSKTSVSVEADTIGQATILADKILNNVSQVVEGEDNKPSSSNLPRPKLLESPDLNGLITTCEAIIDEIENKGYSDEDNPHYVYEEALMTFYGEDIFDKYINKKCC